MLQTRDMMRKFAGCGAGRKAVLARVVKDFRPDFGGEGPGMRGHDTSSFGQDHRIDRMLSPVMPGMVIEY